MFFFHPNAFGTQIVTFSSLSFCYNSSFCKFFQMISILFKLVNLNSEVLFKIFDEKDFQRQGCSSKNIGLQSFGVLIIR